MGSLGKLSARNIIRPGKDIIEQNSALSIPSTFLALLPAFDALVPDALRFVFPPLNTDSSQQVALSATRFHDHLPTAVGVDLIGHSIPDTALLESLQKEWENVQEDGVRSIFHVTNDGKSHYYPTWILTWWELVLSARQKQEKWGIACDWLSQAKSVSNHPAALQVFTQAWDYISHLGWDTVIPFENRCSAADLSFFLSNDWLATRHVDWMLDTVQLRFESSKPDKTQLEPPQNSVIIYSPEVLQGIIRRFETIPPTISPREISRFLSPLQNRIQNGERPRLYTVYNYSDVHWIALEVDFDRQVIRYGDSMGGQRSSVRIRNIIKAWLKATWGYDNFVSEQMPCGTQLDDTTSCGVCAVNTIERQVFEDPLWDEELASAHRASKFMEIAYRVLHLNGSDSSINPPLPISRILADLLPGQIKHNLSIADPPLSPRPITACLSSDDDFLDGAYSDEIDDVEFDALNLTSDQTDGEATDDPEPVHQNRALIGLGLESDSSSDSDSSSESLKRPRKRQKPGKSAAHTRTVLGAVRKGDFQIDDLRWARFEATIKELDKNAVLDQDSPLYVRHSTCGKKFKMRQPYDTKNFKTHVQAKTCGPQATGASSSRNSKSSNKPNGAGMLPLTSFAGFKRRSDRSISTSMGSAGLGEHRPTPSSPATGPSVTSSSVPALQNEVERVCPGISEEDMPVHKRPQYLGLALYLYISGELGDAYQSRHISHADRLWMVLRAKFFLDFWRQFLLNSGYSTSRYFISQPASNILTTIIEGLILLIYAYRDYIPEGTPLLPWLHSSEACEHCFAEMRKLVPDFTYLDFIFAVPKLRVLLRASYRPKTEFPAASTERQRKATGYQHTYMDSANVDLSLLANFPTDGEIAEITYIAYREAILLAQAVNILPDDLVPAAAPEHTNSPNQPEEDTIPEFDTDMTEVLSSSEAFQELVELADTHDLPLESVSIQRDNLVYANAALQTDTAALIDDLPTENDADVLLDRTTVEGHARSTAETIDPNLLESRIQDMNNETLSQQRSSVELNLDMLVQIRQRHQNPRALKSSKNYAKYKAGLLGKTAFQQGEVLAGSSASQHASQEVSTKITHASLALSFAQTLRDQELKSPKISPRLQRWIVSGGETDGQFKGNTANAKKVAETRANAYIKSRRDCLRQRGIPRLLEDIATARITIIDPIKPGSFVWIMSDKQIVLGRVLAIYVKEGGYNGMNLWVPQTTNLGHISYVAVQIYQKVGSRAKYRAIHLGRPMEVPYYQLVPTNELLMCAGFVNTPGSETEDVELKDRHIIEERDELVRLLPELEKAGIPRVGSKTGARS